MNPVNHWNRAQWLLSAALVEARAADAERRRLASEQETPIPKELGYVTEKVWLEVGPDEAEVYRVEKPVGRHLTVWRTPKWEVTVTFDRWEGEIDSSGRLRSIFLPSRPPHTGWRACGPADHKSTIWKRPRKGGHK